MNPRKRKEHREERRSLKAGFLPPTPREEIDRTTKGSKEVWR